MIFGEIARIRKSIREDEDGSWGDLKVKGITDVVIKITRTKGKGVTLYSGTVVPKLVKVPEGAETGLDLNAFLKLTESEKVDDILKALKVSKFFKGEDVEPDEEGWDDDTSKDEPDNDGVEDDLEDEKEKKSSAKESSEDDDGFEDEDDELKNVFEEE